MPYLRCAFPGPGDPQPGGLDAAVLAAGELASLRAGRRDVVMAQLHVGWGVCLCATVQLTLQK